MPSLVPAGENIFLNEAVFLQGQQFNRTLLLDLMSVGEI